MRATRSAWSADEPDDPQLRRPVRRRKGGAAQPGDATATPAESTEPAAVVALAAAPAAAESLLLIEADTGKVLAADSIMASNTSSIPITRMAVSSPDPARFIGRSPEQVDRFAAEVVGELRRRHLVRARATLDVTEPAPGLGRLALSRGHVSPPSPGTTRLRHRPPAYDRRIRPAGARSDAAASTCRGRPRGSRVS